MLVKLLVCGPTGRTHGLGISYLKSNCEGKDVRIKITRHRNDLKDCDLIGVSCTAAGIPDAVEIAKQSKIPVVVGGRGAVWPGLIDHNFKHIVIGEGEVAFKKAITGAAERLIREPNIEDMDSIKFPDRTSEGDTIKILTSRGCQFNCAFCNCHDFWKTLRTHSPEYVCDDVEAALRNNPHAKSVEIVDELFVSSEERLADLHKEWLARSLHKRTAINKVVSANPLWFTSDVARMLREMRVSGVFMGIETLSPKLQRLINKNYTEEHYQKVIDIAQREGLVIAFSFIYGFPGETIADLIPTVKFVRRNKNKIKHQVVCCFAPLPGTQMYDGTDPLVRPMSVYFQEKTLNEVFANNFKSMI